MKPLAGIKVIEVGTLLPGAEAASRLRELGATVTRVVPPAGLRQKGLPGPFLRPMNRGKRLLSLDLRSDRDQKRLHQELAGADILLLGLRPEGLTRLGLSVSGLKQRYPRLIIVSIVGVKKGPFSRRALHDLNCLALSGLLGAGGESGATPVIPPVPLADLVGGGMSAAIACLAALVARQKTKRGAVLVIGMTEEIRRLLAFGRHDVLQLVRGRLPRYNIYRTSDGGHVAFAALEPKFFANFCDAVERPEWKRWAQTFDEPLADELKALFGSRSRDHWCELGLKHDICLVPV